MEGVCLPLEPIPRPAPAVLPCPGDLHRDVEHQGDIGHQAARRQAIRDLDLRARQRRARKVRDRFERQGDAFHRRVLQAYRAAGGPGVVHIDASQPKQVVQDVAWREVAAAFAPTLRGVS